MVDRKAFASTFLGVDGKSIQKINEAYNLFDTYSDSWIRVPVDLWKIIKSLMGKEF